LEPNASSLNFEYNSKINAEISCEQESLITKDKQKIIESINISVKTSVNMLQSVHHGLIHGVMNVLPKASKTGV